MNIPNTFPVPENPKIYHIVHIDRLPQIISTEYLFSDSEIHNLNNNGTIIGMNNIKERRLNELTLESHPNLYVGQCVPFYFCPRSIMLYVIHKGNHESLNYTGGQDPIIHLVADLNNSVLWANNQQNRWAFTLSNAGSYYFEDRKDLADLNQLNWPSIQSNNWQNNKEGKQAEFLMEEKFPWSLIELIVVKSQTTYNKVIEALTASSRKPQVKIIPNWYY